MKTRGILVLCILLLTACEKFDYTADDNSRQYLETYDNLEQAVTGAYAKFARIFTNGVFRNSYQVHEVLGDDIDIYNGAECSSFNGCILWNDHGFQTLDENHDTIYLSWGCERYYLDFETDWLIDYMIGAYKDLYAAIRSQNFILVQAEKSTNTDPAYNSLLGEVFYMRAYSYYRLTRFFGNIPLIIDTDVDYQVNRASFEEIYRQIESDLLMAIQLLPPNSSTARIPYITPNRGSAKALLAEVYLTMGGYPVHDPSKYALAAQYAREVIDSASFLGFGLIDDFANLSDWHYGLHREMVSIMHYKAIFDYESVFNPELGFMGFSTNELTDMNRDILVETKFFNDYPLSYRKKILYKGAPHINEEWDPVTMTYIIDTVYPLQTTTCYRVYLTNYLLDSYDEYWANIEESFVYILRYAHTLLTYAEASARAGNLNEVSYEAVNQVRRRAHKLPVNTPSEYDMTPGLTTEQFLDSVVWERAWECTGEAEGRWFDLLRLEMVGDLNELRDPHEAPPPYEGISEGQYFFPIPEEDIYLNPNLEN